MSIVGGAANTCEISAFKLRPGDSYATAAELRLHHVYDFFFYSCVVHGADQMKKCAHAVVNR